jgi:hypothetical protein
MRSIINRLMIALALCALLSAQSLANGKTEEVNLPEDVNIGGTLVKKGTYKLKFDEQTGQLLVLKGKRVVARTNARLEKRDKEAARTEFSTILKGEARILQSITFRGERESIVMHERGGSSDTPTAVAPATPVSNP